MQHVRKHVLVFALALAATTASAAGIDAGDRAEMAAVLKASITPAKALEIAQSDGSRAFALGLETAGNGGYYEVSILRNHAKLVLHIDANSGKVLSSGAARGEEGQGAEALVGAKFTFADAIVQAELAGGGPALEASAGGRGEQAHVDVDIIQGRGARIAHYRVSIQAGKWQVSLIGTQS